MKPSPFLKIALIILIVTAFSGITWTALGCVETSKGATSDDNVDAAKLWAQTCQQCHNLRPASSFSDAQLQVIVHHMRVRANLTGKEARAILEFMKQAN